MICTSVHVMKTIKTRQVTSKPNLLYIPKQPYVIYMKLKEKLVDWDDEAY